MQNKVKNFNDTLNFHREKMPSYARLLDISSEFGELAKEYLKSTKYGTKSFCLTDDFELEFGDVLYSVLSLANELKINSNKALDMVIEKYKNRAAKNNSIGSGN